MHGDGRENGVRRCKNRRRHSAGGCRFPATDAVVTDCPKRSGFLFAALGAASSSEKGFIKCGVSTV